MPLKKDLPLVIAHRGASAYQPENTLAAYALAVEQRADMIEIDLHRSRDGVVVIAHDAELANLGAEGVIGERSLAELKTLDAGGGGGGQSPAAIPTLDEVLDSFGGKIPFNLELKWGPHGPYPGLEAAAVAAVEERGLLDQTLFSCFEDSILGELRRISPKARLAVLVSPRQPDHGRMVERARAVGAEAVNPHFMLAEPRRIREAHAAGLEVHAYTVDDPDRMRVLVDDGIDGLFTNCPDTMRTLLDGDGGPGAGEASS